MPNQVEVRVIVVAVTVYEGTYPDEGALASSIKRCLEDRRHGLAVGDAVGDVNVAEITDVMFG